MVDTTNQTPSVVFPIPGYTGSISLHHGVADAIGGSDIMASTGSPIVSMVNGTVVGSWNERQMPDSGGNAVEIKGTDGLTYYYAHMLNAPTVKVGDSVVAGQSLGQVNQSGNARTSPPHLHIGIGYGIQDGLGAFGGLGKSYNAVARLQALVADPRANNPQLADPNAQPNPPQISFVPSVAGFDSAHLDGIKLNLQKALAAGIDPFLWLGIVSKESGFDPNAINPTSGACGYAQIYPCISGLTPEQNIDEGIKRLKAFLDACHGNITCALNSYSGGGGPYYVSDVTNRAKAIQGANPDFGTPGFSIPTIGGVSGTPGIGNVTTVDPANQPCPKIAFGNIGPAKIEIPNPLCIVSTALKNMVKTLSDWWKSWQTQHIPNWTFVILGIIFIIIGGLALANSAGMQMPNINMGGAGAAEGAGEIPFSAAELAVL